MTKSHVTDIVVPGIYGAYGLQEQKNKAYALVESKSYRPQGLALSNKYIFVSAYDHTKKVSSVIFMLDYEGHYIKTIALGHKAHVGGLAYDKAHETLWVADSINGQAAITALSLEKIEAYKINSLEPISTEASIILDTTAEVSTLATYKNDIWIGYFSTQAGKGRIQIFTTDWTKKSANYWVPSLDDQKFMTDKEGYVHILSSLSFKAPDKIQGLALDEDYLYITQSFGNKNSKLLRYYLDVDDQKLHLTNGRVATLPPYLEQVSLDKKGNIYPIFESVTPKLRVKTNEFVDRLVSIKPETFKKYSDDDFTISSLSRFDVSESSLN